jgi:hypothetical protein
VAKPWDPDPGTGSDLIRFSDLKNIKTGSHIRFSHTWEPVCRFSVRTSLVMTPWGDETGMPSDAWRYLWYPPNTGFDLIIAECNNCKLVRGENRTLKMHMVILKSCKLPTWLHYQAPFYLLENIRLFCSLTGPLDTALRREVVLSCWDEEVEIALV